MARSAATILGRYLLLDVLFDVVRFPVWWYTRGALLAVQWYARMLTDGRDRLAITVLVKHLGQPMFGDYTREGRLISFLVRIVQFVVSLLLFLLWWVAVSILLISYFLLLPAVVWLIVLLRPHGYG